MLVERLTIDVQPRWKQKVIPVQAPCHISGKARVCSVVLPDTSGIRNRCPKVHCYEPVRRRGDLTWLVKSQQTVPTSPGQDGGLAQCFFPQRTFLDRF